MFKYLENLKLKNSNSMFKKHPDFETKIGGKKCVLYTGVYGIPGASEHFFLMI